MGSADRESHVLKSVTNEQVNGLQSEKGHRILSEKGNGIESDVDSQERLGASTFI